MRKKRLFVIIEMEKMKSLQEGMIGQVSGSVAHFIDNIESIYSDGGMKFAIEKIHIHRIMMDIISPICNQPDGHEPKILVPQTTLPRHRGANQHVGAETHNQKQRGASERKHDKRYNLSFQSERILRDWISQEFQEGRFPVYRQIRNKAFQLSEQSFKASMNWVYRFVKRHKLGKCVEKDETTSLKERGKKMRVNGEDEENLDEGSGSEGSQVISKFKIYDECE